MTDDTEASNFDADDGSQSPEARNDEVSKFDYAAFISYRRSDASTLANWLCHHLERWKPTRDLIDAVPTELAARLQQKRRVFVHFTEQHSGLDFPVGTSF